YRAGITEGERALGAGFLPHGTQALHWLGLAVALDREGEAERGLAAARRALELDPVLSMLHDPHIFFVPAGDIAYYQGMAALARGLPDQAGRHFGDFARALPASRYLARARAHLGRHALAPAAAGSGTSSLAVAVVTAARGARSAPEVAAGLQAVSAELGRCL